MTLTDIQTGSDNPHPTSLLQCHRFFWLWKSRYPKILLRLRNANHNHRRNWLSLLGPIQSVRHRAHTQESQLTGRYVNEADMTLPTNSVSFQAENARSWLVRFWELPGKWVGIAFPFGFVLWILFYFDHNVSVGPQ